MEVKYKKLCAIAATPTKAHPTDAGFDLAAVSCNVDLSGNVVYGTGLAVEIPEGFCGLLFPRSSNAKKDLLLTNSVGVIDCHYRGEIMLKFKPTNGDAEIYRIGDRVGQLIIMPLPAVEMVEVGELSETDRGTGGYGSTGN